MKINKSFVNSLLVHVVIITVLIEVYARLFPNLWMLNDFWVMGVFSVRCFFVI
jgi:hypothetical protein